MDAKELHARFRAATHDRVARSLQLCPTPMRTNWIVQCHASLDEFLANFPSVQAQRQVVEQVEQMQRDSRQSLEEGLKIIAEIEAEGGLNYLQKEWLDYTFPNPCDIDRLTSLESDG